ncbi:hypothetical protein K502DRAFT_322516 [Neoconidiobolus thromboides FSU 785]|nr:hypothetical protein K502DRAFT_322516 [Neoconidiobolus thromboides FSU 785]
MDGTNSQKDESSRLLVLEKENNILKQDYNKLKNERELAREENKMLNEENSQLKQELKKLKSENKAVSRNKSNYSNDNLVAKELSGVSDNRLKQSYDHLKQEYEHAQKLFLKEERILKVKNEEIKKLTTKLFASQKIIEQYKKNESELHSIADSLAKEVKDRDERIKAIKKYLGDSTKNRSLGQKETKGNRKQEIEKIINSMNDYQETYCNQMSFFESKVAEIEYGLEMVSKKRMEEIMMMVY